MKNMGCLCRVLKRISKRSVGEKGRVINLLYVKIYVVCSRVSKFYVTLNLRKTNTWILWGNIQIKLWKRKTQNLQGNTTNTTKYVKQKHRIEKHQDTKMVYNKLHEFKAGRLGIYTLFFAEHILSEHFKYKFCRQGIKQKRDRLFV